MSLTHGKWLGPWTAPGHTYQYGATNAKHPDDGVFTIHAVMLRTGKILIWSGHAEQANINYARYVWEWDPLPDTNRPDPADLDAWTPDTSTAIRHLPPKDIFCCYHLPLKDGKILLLGGSTTHPVHGAGIPQVSIFDPTVPPGPNEGAAFTQHNNMIHGRWYPTAVNMSNGRIVVFTGRREPGARTIISYRVEQFNSPTYQPTQIRLSPNSHPSALFMPTYSSMHLVKGGKIFHIGANWRYEREAKIPPQPLISTLTFSINQNGRGIWESPLSSGLLRPDFPEREEGASILISPAQEGKILLIGGGFIPEGAHNRDREGDSDFKTRFPLLFDNSKKAELLDTQSIPPDWTTLHDLYHPRINASLVNLVDGTVLIIGGHDYFKWCPEEALDDPTVTLTTQTLVCEIFDPTQVGKVGANPFKEVDSLDKPRIYHSAALLLPDGSVFVGGGVDGNPREEQLSNGTAALANPTILWDDALNQKTFEIYRPPYLFIDNGLNRPVINRVLDEYDNEYKIYYYRFFYVITEQAQTISKVVLIRPGSMTHHTDTEQRHVPLASHRVVSPNRIEVTMTSDIDPSVAPEGYYMLFIIDDQGRVCDYAKFVLLDTAPHVPVRTTAAIPPGSIEHSVSDDGFDPPIDHPGGEHGHG